MDLIEALILGIVQGLTEWLPVSSSGHLVIAQELLGLATEENLLFDLVVTSAQCSPRVYFRKGSRG
jgi:undecaprenyl-diphosphatase